METTFKELSVKYINSLQSLREFANGLRPVALQREKESLKEFVDSIEDVLGTKSRKEIAAAIDSIEPATDKTPVLTDESIDTHHKPAKYKIKNPRQFLTHLSAFARRSNAVSLLNKSALVSLISFFEVLLAGIFGEYYRMFPEALSSEEKTLSVNLVRNFKTIEELMSHLAADQVESMLYKGITDWNLFFRKRTGASIEDLLGKQWPKWNEMYQRRHILVHNDGAVSRIYLNRIGDVGETAAKIGDQLEVSPEYLDEAIDLFAIAGLKLVDICWTKFGKLEAETRDTTLIELVYEHIKDARWLVVSELCQGVLNRSCSRESDKIIFQMNYWLSMKRLGQWQTIKDEVDKFDTRAHHPQFSLVVFSLREDYASFFQTLPSAGLNRDSLLEWPILEEMRKHEDFHRQLDNHFPEQILEGKDVLSGLIESENDPNSHE